MLGKLNTYYFDQFLNQSFEVKEEYKGEHDQVQRDFLANIDAMNAEQRDRIETCKKIIRGEEDAALDEEDMNGAELEEEFEGNSEEIGNGYGRAGTSFLGAKLKAQMAEADNDYDGPLKSTYFYDRFGDTFSYIDNIMNHFFQKYTNLDEAWEALNHSFDAKIVKQVQKGDIRRLVDQDYTIPPSFVA